MSYASSTLATSPTSQSGRRRESLGSVSGATTLGSTPSLLGSFVLYTASARAAARSESPAARASRSRLAARASASSSASERLYAYAPSVVTGKCDGSAAASAAPRSIIRSISRSRHSASRWCASSTSSRRLACASATRTSLSSAWSSVGAAYLFSRSSARCAPHGTECNSISDCTGGTGTTPRGARVSGGLPRSARNGRYSHVPAGSRSEVWVGSSGSSGASAMSRTAAQVPTSSSSSPSSRLINRGGAGGGNSPGSPVPRMVNDPRPRPDIVPTPTASTSDACSARSADHLSPAPKLFRPRGSSSSSSKCATKHFSNLASVGSSRDPHAILSSSGIPSLIPTTRTRSSSSSSPPASNPRPRLNPRGLMSSTIPAAAATAKRRSFLTIPATFLCALGPATASYGVSTNA
mmetsp:Transcript_10483/g.48093  ORF Transcript_10483/g.48093 Transcript_10483/m.48093 type:complete len:409 (-) Transcript_10483:5255-6481(-)